MSSTTPLFIDNIAECRGSRFESFLKQLVGPSQGTRSFFDLVVIKGKVDATAPEIYNPATHEQNIALARFHPLLAWNKMMYKLTPGAGSFGRIITVHFGWVPPGIANPKNAAEFASLAGYTVTTFGGVTDPDFKSGWISAPFSGDLHGVIHFGLFTIASPMRLAYYVESEDVGTTKGSGTIATLRFEGEIGIFGKYY